MGTLAQLYSEFWQPALLTCSAMERRGIRLDVDAINSSAQPAKVEASEHRASAENWASARGVASYNPGSDQQTSHLLYDVVGLPLSPVEGSINAIKRRKENKRPTSEAALAWLMANAVKESADIDGLRAIQRYRKVIKQVQFLEKLPAHCSADGRLRSSFAPEAATGRLSSKNPNLQNIPSNNDAYGIRRAFVARPGHVLGVFDFSALEIYILAHYLVKHYGDWSLHQALQSGDVYGAQAKRTWPEHLDGVEAADIKAHADPGIRAWRPRAKVLVLGTNYGKTAGGIALQLGVPDAVGREYHDAYFRANPSIARFQADSALAAVKTGMVRTLLGRHRYIDVPRTATRGAIARAGRQATNTRVQGSAADWVYGCMLSTSTETLPKGGGTLDCGKSGAWYNAELAAMGVELVLQVHDELVFEIPVAVASEARLTIEHAMRNPFHGFSLAFGLAVVGKLVDRWSDAK